MAPVLYLSQAPARTVRRKPAPALALSSNTTLPFLAPAPVSIAEHPVPKRALDQKIRRKPVPILSQEDISSLERGCAQKHCRLSDLSTTQVGLVSLRADRPLGVPQLHDSYPMLEFSSFESSRDSSPFVCIPVLVDSDADDAADETSDFEDTAVQRNIRHINRTISILENRYTNRRQSVHDDSSSPSSEAEGDEDDSAETEESASLASAGSQDSINSSDAESLHDETSYHVTKSSKHHIHDRALPTRGVRNEGDRSGVQTWSEHLSSRLAGLESYLTGANSLGSVTFGRIEPLKVRKRSNVANSSSKTCTAQSVKQSSTSIAPPRPKRSANRPTQHLNTE